MQLIDHNTSTAERPVTIESAAELRSPRTRWGPKAMLVAADAVTLAAAMLLSFLFRASLGGLRVEGAAEEHLAVALAALPVWLIVFARRRLYNARFLGRRVDELRRIASGTAITLLGIMALSYTLLLPISRAWLAVTFVVAVTMMMVERELVRRVFEAARVRGRLQRPLVIVGSNDEAHELAAMLTSQPALGYRVVGFVDDEDRSGNGGLLGPVAETLSVVRRTGAESVIVALSSTSIDVSNRLVRELVREGVHVELSSTLRDIAAHRLTVRPLGRIPIVYVEPCIPGGWRSKAKRAFDVVVSAIALLLVAPVMATIALLIRLDSRGPVIFRQSRVGRHGEVFELYKFRTMVDGADRMVIDLRDRNEATGPLFKMRNDPRVTRIGRFLRRSSLDELPQLMNVLRGEMSLVGPRPALPDEVLAWDQPLHDRLRVQPGITGMWQVSGRSDSTFDDYCRLDLYYVDNWSLLTDLVVIMKTIPVVLFGRGAY